MKIVYLMGILIIFASCVLPVQGQKNATDSASPTPKSRETENLTERLKQIMALKEKIATKVAEIRNKDRAGASGTIKTITSSGVVLENGNGAKNITLAEDTTYFLLTPQAKSSINFKKLAAGDFIVVIGYWNDENKTLLLAKYVYLTNTKIHIIGKIADIDKANFTLTVRQKQGNQIVDIENYTKISTLTKDKGKIKSGFSKFKIGDYVHILAQENKKDTSRVSADKIAILPIAEAVITMPSAVATPSGIPAEATTAETPPAASPTVGTKKTPTP